MSMWCFDQKQLRNTPSFKSGIDNDMEARFRREGTEFLNRLADSLGLRVPCATGIIYFQRFYMFHSFKEFDKNVVATACLLLAGKVEETPKKLKDIIKEVQEILANDTEAWHAYGSNPKEEVLTMEKILLQTIKFDLQVEHPYKFLVRYAKTFKAPKAAVQNIVQMAWTFVNDSLCTTLSLMWEPEIIAIALIYLACKLNKTVISDWHDKQPGDMSHWWDQFVADLPESLLEEICHNALDLYSSNNANASSGEQQSPKKSSTRTPSDSVGVAPAKKSSSGSARSTPQGTPAGVPIGTASSSGAQKATSSSTSRKKSSSSAGGAPVGTTVAAAGSSGSASYMQSNPYMSHNMYGASFLSAEGNQKIQTMVSSQVPVPPGAAPLSVPPPTHPVAAAAAQHAYGYGQPSYGPPAYGNYPSSASQAAAATVAPVLPPAYPPGPGGPPPPPAAPMGMPYPPPTGPASVPSPAEGPGPSSAGGDNSYPVAGSSKGGRNRRRSGGKSGNGKGSARSNNISLVS